MRPGEFREDSDVDVLVSFADDSQANRSFEAWLDMREELAQIFGRDVDVAERANIMRMRNYLRREAILTTAVPLDVA